MCLIIAPGRDGQKALLPRSVFDYAYSRNQDGFGAMWVEDGEVKHFKTLGLTADEVYAQMEERVERNEDAVFHLRLKTHGKVVPALCHPFRILHRNRHGKDLFFMHNGILGSFGNSLKYGQSDTTVFKDKILVPLLTRNPDALDDPETMDAINRLTSGSRLIFMDSTGKVWRTSESSWNGRYGLTLSNTYMLPASEKAPSVVSVPSTYTSYPSEGNVTNIGGKSGPVYNLFRNIVVSGRETGHWCAPHSAKLIRTESGLLYEDQGVNERIYHSKHFVPSDQAFRYMTMAEAVANDSYVEEQDSSVLDVPLSNILPEYMEEEEPDPLVWSDPGAKPVDPVVDASQEEKLRYARLVHNCYNGNVEVSTQLVADVLGMGDKELIGFVKEDHETAATVIAELLEIILAMDEDGNVFDADELLSRGSAANHRNSMQDITLARRARYEAALERKKLRDEENERKVA